MARLVSYKVRDENRYSTFDGETSYNSSENLTESNRIKFLPRIKSKSKDKSKKDKKKKLNKKQEHQLHPTVEVPKPTSVSASIENHRNRITQSGTIIGSRDYITRGRRRHPAVKSKLSSCFDKKNFSCCCKCNWNWINCLSSQCLCCWLISGCGRRCGCIDNSDNDDDDDDIDAKFERYKYEMRLKELNQEQNAHETTTKMTESVSGADPTNLTQIGLSSMQRDQNNEIIVNDLNGIDEQTTSPKVTKFESKKFRYRKYWNWNDSLRSNSDKFLETLEYDMDGELSLKRTNAKYKRTDAPIQSIRG